MPGARPGGGRSRPAGRRLRRPGIRDLPSGPDCMRREGRLGIIGGNTVMDTLGGCRVLGELGKGAMGTVYKADRGGALVALKVLADEWAKDATLTDRFVQEGLIMARLSHPAIVK